MHPAERFVGVRYDPDAMDCADFVAHVRRELHGHEVRMPHERPRGDEGRRALGDLAQQYGKPTDDPQDGDLVLMRAPGRRWHVGLFYWIGGDACVLHCASAFGCSVIHALRDLPRFLLRVEGIYRWTA